MEVAVDGAVEWTATGDGGNRRVVLERGTTPEAWRWVTRDGSVRRVPPYDLLEATWSDLAPLPGVDLSYASTERHHLLGDVTVRVSIDSGRPVHVLFGAEDLRDGTDAWFEFPAARRIEQRAGLISSAEMVSPPGTLGGSLEAAMLIAGLVEPWAAVYNLQAEDLMDLLSVYAALDCAPSPWST